MSFKESEHSNAFSIRPHAIRAGQQFDIFIEEPRILKEISKLKLEVPFLLPNPNLLIGNIPFYFYRVFFEDFSTLWMFCRENVMLNSMFNGVSLGNR